MRNSGKILHPERDGETDKSLSGLCVCCCMSIDMGCQDIEGHQIVVVIMGVRVSNPEQVVQPEQACLSRDGVRMRY